MSYVIRPMQDMDIPHAIEIDREAFPDQWPHPTYASFKHELRNRLAHYTVVSKAKPAAQNTDGKGLWQRLSQVSHLFDHDRFFGEDKSLLSKHDIIGISGFWIMVDEAHINTIAVRNAYRRQGIGEWLLIFLIDMAKQLQANTITLEVRVSNKEAQELYRKYGFREVGIRRRYYTNDGEDALIMTTDTMTSASFQSQFDQLKQAHQGRWRGMYYRE